MLAALIPPRGLESYALASNFHLALPISATMHNDKYVSTYREAATRDDYIVMDNGAADGGLVTTSRLLEAAMALGAKEVVAPDSLFGTANTLALVKKFLISLEAEGLQERFKVQAVAQGRDVQGFKDCITAYADEPLIKVLGLPKHMMTTLDSHPARIDMAHWVAREFPDRFEIHMLGTNPEWLGELVAVRTYTPYVRSVDSALPFNYAIYGKLLDKTSGVYLRHPDYFVNNWANMALMLVAEENVFTYMKWAGAGEPQRVTVQDNFGLK